jgi:hypothetical protein
MPAKSTFGSASVIPYSSSSGSYKISRSLRFNPSDSAYLSRTPSAAGNRKTWTFSAWVKRSTIGSAEANYILGSAQAPSGTTGIYLGFGSDTLFFGDYATSGWDWYLQSSSLFRDTSAWYHVVAQYDSTQATASERAKLYVNGVRLTAFDGASTYPGPSADSRFNQASVEMAIGRLGTYNGNYFNGYIAEVNFIDGQALDPSSFGYTDSITGSWLPKKYVGTYGTNGFYLPFQNQSTTANYFTYSEDFSNVFWTKYLCTCVTNATTAPNGTNTADKMVINNGQVQGQFYTTGSATDNAIWTSSVYLKALDFTTGILYIQKKDGVFAYIGFDLATGTVTDGINGAIGGTITSVGDGWYRVTCTVNLGTGANTTFNINYQFTGNGDGVKGSYIWGAQLEQGSSAGPYMYTVTSAQNPTLALGEDRSLPTGGYNNWVATNLSVTSGAGNDSLLDSPTDYGTDTGLGGEVRGNYCTFNPLKRGSTYANLSNGNLTIAGTTGGAGQQSVQANIAMSSGKWYAEATITTIGAESSVGIAKDTQDTGLIVGNGAFSYGYYLNGLKYNNNSGTSYGASYTSGDVIGVAFDADAGNLVFYKNGVSQGTAFTGLTNGPYVFEGQGRSATSGNQNDWNFGQQAWRYAPPSGFKALCTTNLPIPSIKKSSTFFDAITYNGTGTTFVSPSGLKFAPDLVWVKSRSQNISHVLSDTVRGTGEVLCSNNTRAGSPDSFLTNFNQDGFTLNTSITANNSGSTYVAWAWQASSTSSTNTNGSITSTVRANPQAGFSIVSFVNASGTNQETVGHGLGVVPKMIIAKNRDTNVNNWGVYHSSVCDTTSKFLRLNTTDAVVTFSTVWGASLPTPSVFGVTGGGLSVASVNMIAYCFAEIDGYSKFGSYAGNASTDGPFVYCGFRPRFLMIKRTDSAEPWIIKDTARSIYNGYDVEIYPNYSNTEGGPYSPPIMDYVSNGFKLRSNTTASNGGTIIFAAFAESPFKYARAK